MGLLETLAPKSPPLRLDQDGVIRVGGTRVTLDTVIEAHKEGASPKQIVSQYDSLKLADVYVVIGYYLDNRAEVEAYLDRRREQAEQVRRQVEARTPQHGIRERLLARRRPAD
jgi:uncharacterized protein (DUF433 family)